MISTPIPRGSRAAVALLAYLLAAVSGAPLVPILEETWRDRELPQKVGMITDILSIGSYTYATGESGLLVIDESTPQFPQIVSTVSGTGNNLVQSGSFLFVGGALGLTVYDISTGPEPRRVSSPIAGYIKKLQVDGEYLYIGREQSNVQRVRLKDLSGPSAALETLRMSTVAQNFHASGSLLIQSESVFSPVDAQVEQNGGAAAKTESGTFLNFLDISDFSRPKTLAKLRLDEGFGGETQFLAQGRMAYVIRGDRFLLVDFSNAAQPKILSQLPLADPAENPQRFLDGRFLTPDILAGGVIQVLPNSLLPRKLAISGGLAFISLGQTLKVINVSDSAKPSEEISLERSNTPYAMEVTAQRRVKLGSSAGLELIDFSTPKAPLPLGGLLNHGSIRSMAVVGDRVVLGREETFEVREMKAKMPSNTFSILSHAPGTLLALNSQHAFAFSSGGSAQWLSFSELGKPLRAGPFPVSVQGPAASAAGRFSARNKEGRLSLFLLNDGPTLKLEEKASLALDKTLAAQALGPRHGFLLLSENAGDGRAGGVITFLPERGVFIFQAAPPPPESMQVVDWEAPEPSKSAILNSSGKGTFIHVAALGRYGVVSAVGLKRSRDFPEGVPPGIYLIDPSAKGGPKFVSTAYVEAGRTITKLRALGNRLFVAKDKGGFDVFEVSEPSVRLERVARVPGGAVLDFAEYEGRTLVASSSEVALYRWEAARYGITKAEREAGAVRLTLEGTPGLTVRLLRSNDLRAWEPWWPQGDGVPLVLEAQATTVSDNFRPRESRAFYRVISP